MIKRVAENMSVSIIIPTFNGASRIGNCLDALLKQGEKADMQILVVNDGSTDKTVDVVARYSGVRLINQANAGPAAGRNRGSNESNGSIILFAQMSRVPRSDLLS